MVSFYRIVRSSPPTLQDFTSNSALGRVLRDPDPERQHLWHGISVNATASQARTRARDFPALGRWIARLDIPSDAPVVWARTLPNSRGHHTLWGEPDVLLRCVVDVAPV
jgi:hypothetical protein